MKIGLDLHNRGTKVGLRFLLIVIGIYDNKIFNLAGVVGLNANSFSLSIEQENPVCSYNFTENIFAMLSWALHVRQSLN